MITVCFFGPLSVMAFSYYNILMFTKNLKRRIAVSRNYLAPTPLHQEPVAEEKTQNDNPEDIKVEGPEINRHEEGTYNMTLRSKPKFQITPEETKITNMFLYGVALFMFCWAPFVITMFIDMYYSTPLPHTVDIASLLLGYLNSICNPILYGLHNSAFKQGFLNLYSRFLPKRFKHTNVT